MAYLFRLICLLFALVIPSYSFAALSVQVTYCDGQGHCGTPSDIVAWWQAYDPVRACIGDGKPATWSARNITEGGFSLYKSAMYCNDTGPGEDFVLYVAANGMSCPANSTKSGSSCVCDSGYTESGNRCVKKPDGICSSLSGMSIGISSMESDFGPQSAKWAASKLGQSGNACMTGCQTSGTITSCVAGTGKSSSTVCYLSNPSFTGAACTDPSTGGSGGEGSEGGKDKPQDCPVGYEASKYAPGVCIPKENNCPSGSSPSKYAEGVCIPDEKGDDGSCEDPKDPTKRAECEGKGNQCPAGQVQSTTQTNTCVPAKDGADKGKDGSKVECKDGKCTVTKPDGSKEDKGQDEVCKEQPDLAMCKESKGQFSGSCSANFRCDGDVLQCAALQEQHKRNCTLFDVENDMSRFFDAEAKKPQENVLTANGTEIDLKGHITVDSIIGNGQCPADVPLQVFGKTVVFKLSEFCRYFNAMGMLLFLSTCATCLRILGT